MHRKACLPLAVVTVLVAVGLRWITAAEPAAAKANRVFELRTYYANPGKMQALHTRFRDHTCALFKKHGMELIGFWSPTNAKEAESKLVYLLAFPSRDAAKKSWEGFGSDPEWNKAREASEKDGKLVAKFESLYMSPTDYSDLK